MPFNAEDEPALVPSLSGCGCGGGEKCMPFDWPEEGGGGRRLGWRWRESEEKGSREGESCGLSCILAKDGMLFGWKFIGGDSKTTGVIL